jgi:hypothetical protein
MHPGTAYVAVHTDAGRDDDHVPAPIWMQNASYLSTLKDPALVLQDATTGTGGHIREAGLLKVHTSKEQSRASRY